MTVVRTKKQPVAGAAASATSTRQQHPSPPRTTKVHPTVSSSGSPPGASNSTSSPSPHSPTLLARNRGIQLLQKATKQVLLDRRAEASVEQEAPTTPTRKHKKTTAAPFSIVSPFQRVRALLDPVRDRHLLGGDTLQSARNTGDDRRRSLGGVAAGSRPGAHPHVPQTRLIMKGDSLHMEEGALVDENVAFEPGVDVPLETVMVPLGVTKWVWKQGHRGEPPFDPMHVKLTERMERVDAQSSALQFTHVAVAIERIRELFVPHVRVSMHRKRYRLLERSYSITAARPSADAFKKFKLFALWPQELLNQAADALQYRMIPNDRFIWYAGEPGGTLGIVLLSKGTCKSLRNGNRWMGEKRLTEKNAVVLGTHAAGHMFNEYSFVTEEPQMRYVKTTSRCDLWCLDKKSFDACCAQLPENVKHAMAQLAFLRRQKMIPEAYPFFPHNFKKQCPTFANNTDEMVGQLIQELKPLATRPNHVLVREGETPQALYFLRRGTVGVYQEINRNVVHVRTIVAPATVVESAVIHRQENMEMLKTITDCDFLMIGLEEFHTILNQHPSERDIILEVSREEKMKILSKLQLRFRPAIFQIPIIRHLLDADQISTIAHLFSGRVYSAMEAIVSRSEMCDRIVILTKGSVSFGQKGPTWRPGEAIGFTCLIPHRWAHTIVAMHQCECLELKREYFEAFLDDCGCLNDALDLIELMMCPEKLRLFEERQQLEEKGVVMTAQLRKLHQSGRLSPLRRNALHHRSPSSLDHSDDGASGSFAGSASQAEWFQPRRAESLSARQVREKRLFGILQSLKRDISLMATPLMFPETDNPAGLKSGHCLRPGFVQCRQEFAPTELAVPGGLYCPKLKEADKQDALITAWFNHKRDPAKRVSKITPFLMVKQR